MVAAGAYSWGRMSDVDERAPVLPAEEEKPRRGRPRVYDRQALADLWADPSKFASKRGMAKAMGMPEAALRKILRETGAQHRRAVEEARQAETEEAAYAALTAATQEQFGGKKWDEQEAWRSRIILSKFRDDPGVPKDIRAKIAILLVERYDKLLPQDIHESDERVCEAAEVEELHALTGRILKFDAERAKLSAVLAAIPENIPLDDPGDGPVREPEGGPADVDKAAS